MPPEVAKHHFAGQNDRSRIHLVLTRVPGRRAMGSLEDRVSSHVVDVGSRRDADAAYLSSQRVGDVVSVQVHGGDDAVFFGPSEDLLEKGVGDHVLDQQSPGQPAPGPAVYVRGAVLLSREGVTPVPEA